MYCYKCGCELDSSDTCPNCGADVRQYKQIIYTSNYLYNEGLRKAGVRDLSGAIVCLKESLVFNKDNLDARNLLGLIYYEIGETVAALSEWVISKNLNDDHIHVKKNLAEEYLSQVQNDKQITANIDASIKRYNHALDCCYSGNLDVAILQLKKVISVNAHYLRARQLLALLYIEKEDYRRAERELQKCLRLDINNTDTLQYLKETEEALQRNQEGESLRNRNRRSGEPEKRAAGSSRVEEKDGVIKYKADNETIIQPVGSKVPGIDGFRIPGWVYGGIIGLIAGAAVVAFLVMPSRVQAVRNEAAQQVRALSEQSSSQQDTISDLQGQINTLSGGSAQAASASQTESVTAEGTDGAAETVSSSDALYGAADAWVEATTLPDSADTDALTSAFASLDPDTATDGQSTAFTSLYNDLYTKLRSPMLERYAWEGINAYEAENPDYTVVIRDLELANKFEDETSLSMTYVQRLWYLGDAYYQVYIAATDEQKQGVYADYLSRSRAYLEQVTSDYPDSEYASQCESRLLDIATNASITTADTASSGSSTQDAGTAAADGAAQGEADNTAENQTTGENTAGQ